MMRSLIWIFLSLALIYSCQSRGRVPLSDSGYSIQRDSVRQLMAQIAEDVSRNGPIVWLKYFMDSSAFFMVSDGQLVFPSYDSAFQFVKTKLIRVMIDIQLSWKDIRIDPLTQDLAIIAASFNERITDSSHHQMNSRGYFTALAQQTHLGWKLRDANWSLESKSP
jgi:hypothetical protein